jgi:periplasmic protein TonB
VFEDSLFATNARRAPQRGLAAVLSFAIQIGLLSVLVMVPLLYTDALPLSAIRSTYIEVPMPAGPPPAPPPQAVQRAHPQQSSNMRNNILVLPPSVPSHAAVIVEDPIPAPNYPYAEGAIGPGTGRNGNALNNILVASNMRPAPPNPPPAPLHPVKLSTGVTEGLLIQRITPPYPPLAVIAHQEGDVVMQAIIGRDGTIQNLHVVSGPPMLVPAAMDAVRRWRYRPYLLSGEPVEVDTQIRVHFSLNH